MTTSHLENCITFIEKSGFEITLQTGGGDSFDTDSLYYDEEKYNLENIYYNMKKELAFRSLGFDFKKPKEVYHE